jgi:hypothetical protein
MMDVHNEDERRRLWKEILKFEAGSELQESTLICGADIRELGFRDWMRFRSQLG